LDRVAADFVHEVADLEFGLPEELLVGLAGQQFGDLTELGIAVLAETLVDLLGPFGLLGREMRE
jgi:hypothetical protein